MNEWDLPATSNYTRTKVFTEVIAAAIFISYFVVYILRVDKIIYMKAECGLSKPSSG